MIHSVNSITPPESVATPSAERSLFARAPTKPASPSSSCVWAKALTALHLDASLVMM
jgi:hypothetical protein